MMQSDGQITRICKAVDAWLGNESGLLEQARERTISDGLFTLHDVGHMLEQVARTVTCEAITAWVEKSRDSYAVQNSGRKDSAVYDKNVLCLHAGNLPMIGLQDIIATLLSGARYHGKLSARDPWLLDGLLRLLQKQLPENVITWSTNLDDFEELRADRILFAGSEASVEPVTSRLWELRAAGKAARFLNRTARFSIAWLSGKDVEELRNKTSGAESPGLLNDLVEAVMRYEGRGCRSVAVVVAPCELSDVAGTLIPALQDYVKKYPFLHSIKPEKSYWASYLETMDRDFFESGPIILTGDTDLMGKEDVVCWISGDAMTVQQIFEKAGPKVQSIYTVENPLPLYTEALSRAQKPPIDWKPDGVDVLRWLSG